MKHLKLILLVSAIIGNHHSNSMNQEVIAGTGRGARARKGSHARVSTDTPAPWATAGASRQLPDTNLRAELAAQDKDKRKRDGRTSSSDSSSSPQATGVAAPAPTLAAAVPTLVAVATGAGESTVTATPPTTPSSPRIKFFPQASTTRPSSPLFADAELVGTSRATSPTPTAGAGCGTSASSITTSRRSPSPTPRGGAGSGPSASEDDYDSEKETIYKGLHPDISTQRGEYHPGTGILGYFFPGALTNLKDGKKVPARDIEKAAAETSLNKFSPEDVAEFSKLIKSSNCSIAMPYLGNLNKTCKENKEKKSLEILDAIRSAMRQVLLSKKGEKASLDVYGRMNGSGQTSPLAGYGVSRRFKTEREKILQFVGKLLDIEEAMKSAYTPPTGK